jgi:hypothetical protein
MELKPTQPGSCRPLATYILYFEILSPWAVVHPTPLTQAMLADYAANPAANWKSKDCAIYLVLALTVRGKTSEWGAT